MTETRRPTYVLYPGWVISRTDGDRHYVGVGALRELYRVPSDARVVVVDGAKSRPFHPEPDAIHCRPRYDGRYPVFER